MKVILVECGGKEGQLRMDEHSNEEERRGNWKREEEVRDG